MNIYLVPPLPSFLWGIRKKLRFFQKKARFLLFAKTTPWGRTLKKKVIGCLDVA